MILSPTQNEQDYRAQCLKNTKKVVESCVRCPHLIGPKRYDMPGIYNICLHRSQFFLSLDILVHHENTLSHSNFKPV